MRFNRRTRVYVNAPSMHRVTYRVARVRASKHYPRCEDQVLGCLRAADEKRGYALSPLMEKFCRALKRKTDRWVVVQQRNLKKQPRSS